MNTNDTAFPVLDHTQTPNETFQLGLTKREWLAGMALQSLASAVFTNQGATAIGKAAKKFGVSNQAVIAMMACEYADALLVELAKQS